VVKAVLVALYYMHLRWEHFAISLMALAPVILFVILTLALFPDFVG
jgi:caa(3)-type oxidase subunit IV